MSQPPALTPLSLSHLCARYLRLQFENKLNASSPGAGVTPIGLPLMLPIALASELDLISSTLVDAFRNPKKVEWDATRYAELLPKTSNTGTKQSNEKEASLRRRYPPLNGVTASTPCIIVDTQGIILVWYLPGILSNRRQKEMLEARDILSPSLKFDKCGSSSWRDHPEIYRRDAKGPQGLANLSPAWFQQGHDRMSQDYPHASINFRSPAALEWLDAISESNAIVSAILAVIHPNLYEAGRQTTKCLRDTPEIGSPHVLSQWASVFSGVSVISNRITPPHRDVSSRYNWYDILVTLGTYRDCNLELPGLGVALEYGPGTVVGLSGKVLEHAVPSFDGDRVCYAYFMRNNVHEWARVPGSDWMYTKYYKSE